MATAASRDIRKQLNSMTECAICSDTYSDPRVLPCVHTYCLKCIRRVCEDKQPRDGVPCPLCRKVFKIPKSGVDGLPKNFLVEQLKDVADKSSIHCEICFDETSSAGKKCATHVCVECGQRMCEACANGHRRTRLTSSHKLVEINDGEDITEIIMRAVIHYCDDHPNEVLKYYCFNCREVICVTCFVEMHNAHKCLDVNKVADEFRTQVKNDMRRMVDTVTKCRERIQEQKQNKSDFGDKVANVERAICDRAERLKEMIDREKESLLTEVESLKKDRMKQIDHVIDEIEQHVTLTESLVKYAEELIQKGTAGDVTQQTSSIQESAEELLKLDTIQKAILDLGLVDITLTPMTSHTQSSGGWIGQVHRHVRELKLPTLMHIIPRDEGQVVGITSLNDQLFVLRDPCAKLIQVYSTSTFELQRTVRLDGLKDKFCNGLISCGTNNCIYVSDFMRDTIFRVDLTVSDKIVKWKIDSPRGLSVNALCNVIVSRGDNMLVEYTTRGKLVREITLTSDVTNPQHAIQLTNGHFVVSHWKPVHGVSVVDSCGQLVVSYRNNQSTQLLNEPGQLAVDKNDCVIVADSENNRVLVLNSSLSCARVLCIPIRVDGGLKYPWCLEYDESRGRLYVGEYGGNRVFVCDDVSISVLLMLPCIL